MQQLLRDAADLQARGAESLKLQKLEEAVERFPDDIDANVRLGAALVGIDDDRSRRLLLRVADDDAASPSNLTFVATMLVELDEIDAASRCVSRALAIVGDEFDLGAQLAHVAGLVAEARGQSAAAEQFFRIAYETEPGFAGHAARLAELYVRERRFEDARNVVAVGLEHRPGDRQLLALRSAASAGT